MWSVQFKQFIFKLRVHEEIYIGSKQVKSVVMNAEKMELSSKRKFLSSLISEMMMKSQSSKP
jgi:hypothetical protein